MIVNYAVIDDLSGNSPPVRSRRVRLNADGSQDTTFVSPPPAGGWVRSLEYAAKDSKKYPTEFNLNNGGYRLTQRTNPDGTKDESFTATISATLSLELLPLADGKLIVHAGHADAKVRLNGVQIPLQSRLNEDGSLDTTFTAPTEFLISQIIASPDGKLLAISAFDLPARKAREARLHRLGIDGTIDASFLTGIGPKEGSFSVDHVEADGKIVISISSPKPEFNGQPHSPALRLNPDGSIDATYYGNSLVGTATAPGQFGPRLELPDGKILLTNSEASKARQ